MASGTYPRATCPSCGRSVAGKAGAGGKLVLRPHKKALMGTRASGWGAGQDCPGSRVAVDMAALLPGSDRG
jgi:hypothetical protein